MKTRKRTVWISGLTALIVAVFFVSLPSVRALISNAHTLRVLFRVESEIMRTTPAGQHYEALFWKHNDELMQISRAYPENDAEFMRVTEMFVPGLEALLDGEGDSVVITQEQVDALQAELTWVVAVASPELQFDIQQEMSRTPLENFVGMNMNEALDYINSQWEATSISDQMSLPSPMYAETPGWLYYVNQDVYFEYPEGWQVQEAGIGNGYFYFIPASNSVEALDLQFIKIHVWNVPADQQGFFFPQVVMGAGKDHTFYWQQTLVANEFQGLEYVYGKSGDEFPALAVRLYHAERQLAVDMVSVIRVGNVDEISDFSGLVNEKYSDFQHIVESIRIWQP